MEFSGRSVVLTGVGREGQVGEAVARAFAERGARVFLVDRQESEAQARSDALIAAGLRSAAVVAGNVAPRLSASCVTSVADPRQRSRDSPPACATRPEGASMRSSTSLVALRRAVPWRTATL